MLHMKRKLMMAAAGVLAALMVFPAYGASRKPIKSISLTIKAEIKPDTDFGDELIEIETSSNKYSVDGYEILNDDVEWREDTVPRIQITLTANDDYYFQSLPKDKVTIKGGAEFKNSKREDSSTTLLMDVELQALNTSLHALTNVVLTEDGIATWDAIPAAGSYEVRVYRDDKAVGAVMTVSTNTCNCRERMQKGNTAYTVRVRPVSKFDSKEKRRLGGISQHVHTGGKGGPVQGESHRRKRRMGADSGKRKMVVPQRRRQLSGQQLAADRR